MKFSLERILPLVLLHTALTTAQSYSQASAVCVEYSIPVNPSSSNLVFSNSSKWTDDFGLSQFRAYRAGQDPKQQPPAPFLATTQPFNASYTIGATFCQPKSQNTSTVILASHGLGFDRS